MTRFSYTSTHLSDDFDLLLTKIRKETHLPLLFTICVGANDACFRSPLDPDSSATLVPLPEYESNIRNFVDALLIEPKCADMKILLITPPPIAVYATSCLKYGSYSDPIDKDKAKEAMLEIRSRPGFRTYASKYRFADAVMAIAHEYAESESSRDRVMGCDVWRGVVNAALRERGKAEQDLLKPWPTKIDWDQDANCVLPGSGFPANPNALSMEFPKDWYLDGLHFTGDGYVPFTAEIVRVLEEKWPGLFLAEPAEQKAGTSEA